MIRINFTIGRAERLISENKGVKDGGYSFVWSRTCFRRGRGTGLDLQRWQEKCWEKAFRQLVQAGNPKGIKSLKDLAEDGARIGVSISGCLVGVWDDVCSKADLTDQIRRNITDFADGCGAVMALINQKKVDLSLGGMSSKIFGLEHQK